MNPLMILGLVRRERLNDLDRACERWVTDTAAPANIRQPNLPNTR